MTVGEILSIVFAALTVIIGLLSYYFYIRNKIQQAIASGIDNAEELEEIGEEKMATVISGLKQLIPAMFRPFISDDLLKSLVQAVFDSMKAFAEKQAQKQVEEGADEQS